MRKISTMKICGLYIGEILLGTVVICGFVAALMLAVNMAIPAYQ